MHIEELFAREILDSRGNPTVEAEVWLVDGTQARASVPSGASTGEAEAVELRDRDSSRFSGKGVLEAVKNINGPIADELADRYVVDQREIDLDMIALDGTSNKGDLGANAILAVSEAVARAAAMSLDVPLYRYLGGAGAHRLPVPMMNVLNGGEHADNNVDVQEFMVVPVGAESFAQALQMGAETYHALKSLLKSRGLSTAIGDEGGFAPDLENDEEALDLLVAAVEKAGYKAGKDIYLAIDTAASSAWNSGNGTYRIGEDRSAEDLVKLYSSWVDRFPLISVEDGVGEHDREGWQLMTKTLGDRIQLVADDYVVTNPALIRQAVSDGIANGILIKPNQIGTVTETLEAVELTKRAGYGVVISHRSGETDDSFIADLAVGVDADFIKTGAPCRMDRVCKYNQLLRIEEEMGAAARFSGPEVAQRLKL